MNKFFSAILFLIGIGLLIVGACGNFVFNEVMVPDVMVLNTWGIIWRIGLGLLLIIIAVLLGNMETFSKSNPDDF